MSNYQKYKEKAKQRAIQWQSEYFGTVALSYAALANWQGYFYRLGKNYGLVREFRENGII